MADNTIEALGELMPTVPTDIDEEARAVAELGAELKAGSRNVFFYAASGFDWQPLHRFSHMCDCFVYVDPRCRDNEFAQARQQLIGRQTKAGDGLRAVAPILHPRSAYETLTEATGLLAVMRNEPWAGWTGVHNLQDRQPWGTVQRLQRKVGGTIRDLWFVFVAGSPLIAYERLFVATGTAPVCLALCVPRFAHAVPAEGLMEVVVNPPHDLPPVEQLWDNLMGWNGELGQLLKAHNTPLPNYLVADDAMEWPTHALWHKVTQWRNRWFTQVFKMRNEPWPDVAPVPAGRRRVVVTSRPVNPMVARSVGAVVVGHDKYQQYKWPDGVLVIVVGPPIHPDQVVADGPGVLNLDIGGIPLLRALAEIERVCAERGIDKVAVQESLGFEDEADDLALWRQQDGQIRELTLHVECDGHLLDYGQVADEID